MAGCPGSRRRNVAAPPGPRRAAPIAALNLPFAPDEAPRVSAEVLPQISVDAFPHVTRVMTEVMASGRVEEFEFGLDLILDGLERGLRRSKRERAAEWLYVLSRRMRLILGDHDVVLGPGEIAEVDTRVPTRSAAPANNRRRC